MDFEWSVVRGPLSVVRCPLSVVRCERMERVEDREYRIEGREKKFAARSCDLASWGWEGSWERRVERVCLKSAAKAPQKSAPKRRRINPKAPPSQRQSDALSTPFPQLLACSGWLFGPREKKSLRESLKCVCDGVLWIRGVEEVVKNRGKSGEEAERKRLGSGVKAGEEGRKWEGRESWIEDGASVAARLQKVGFVA